MIRFDPFVSVPLAAAAGIQLLEPDAQLDQPPKQQTHAAERLGLLLVDAVQRLRVGGLLRQIDRFRSGLVIIRRRGSKMLRAAARTIHLTLRKNSLPSNLESTLYRWSWS